MRGTIIDQMGRAVEVPVLPKRIVSLVPSQTELLIDLGLPVVGRTKFCIHPADRVRDIPVIGGTKNFRFDQIYQLKPDLIIGNKEENYSEGITELEKHYPVWMSDISTIADALDMILSVSKLGGAWEKGEQMISQIETDLHAIQDKFSGRVLYLIWKNPLMAAGPNTFIHAMLTHLGFENVITADRYPELTDQDIQTLQPDYILFSSEPFPFKESDILDATEMWSAKSQLVDGEMFSWYGSRLLKVRSYCEQLITSL